MLYSGFMKKILITTDFTFDAKYTLHYVLELLRETQFPCKILLLNTFMVQQTDPSKIIALNDEMKLRSKSGLERQRAEALVGVRNANLSIETASHMGSLTNVILQLLSTSKIDLVAMGKHSGKRVEGVAELLQQKQCSLLITHAKRADDQSS